MRKRNIGAGIVTAASLLAATSAYAGGLERGGYNIDLLFDPSDYAAEAAATYVAPQRDLNNVVDINPLNGDLNSRPNDGIRDTESYWVPRLGVKAKIFEGVDCMADYSQPWGAHTNPGENWAGANDNIETKIESDNYAATCSYKWDVGQGQLRLIGGGFYQEVGGFKERLVADLTGTGIPLSGKGRLDLEGSGWGWRTGVAYEIPDYALRVSLVYNSAVDLDNLDGTIDLRNTVLPVPGGGFVPGTLYDVESFASMPDSLELKFQTGVAPDWLVFGSVKWTDWSQLQIIKVTAKDPTDPRNVPTSLDLLYRDGWTVSGGVGHKFNEKLSGAVSLTWDRGTSHGYGNQTDTWALGSGVSYNVNDNIELRLSGALGLMTSGSSGPQVVDGVPVGGNIEYDFGTDYFAAISTSLKVKF
ncbi:OmpP1/FadL family transporter [Sinorhizobium sp. RAC02]|uniref:OmpP1/FadL family transporter n=1 Tax=Sinorhizobium sp. RAC02 TaxID=1842534 RepID=UPI00083E1A93|nr:OmpP1/FadL family transporter [Sinorhizobium sp. RAC02]AOF91907.1 metA-pathway of phenol degradation family protein [Sinorhizobium sp. RAC02]